VQGSAQQNVELQTIVSRKACSMCEIEKPLSPEFYHRSSSSKSGFQHKCKDCCKKWHSDRKQEMSKSRSEYRYKNREAINKQKREHHHKNKERLNKQRKPP